MFNKKGFKKAGLCIVTALVIMGTSGCNTKIKPNYGYNPTDHVELGQYKGIEYSVDEEGIEKDIINKRILSDQKDNITYQEITSRGAKEADKVTVDFSATINGLQVSGFSNNDYEIVLGTDKVQLTRYTVEIDTKIFQIADATAVTCYLIEEIASIMDPNTIENVRNTLDLILAGTDDSIEIKSSLYYSQILTFGINVDI